MSTSKIKYTENAATRKEINLPKEIKSNNEMEYPNSGCINKWWILEQICKGGSVTLKCVSGSPMAIVSFGLLTKSIYQDIKNRKHRGNQKPTFLTTSSLWDDVITYII